jgi:hypothetical protein
MKPINTFFLMLWAIMCCTITFAQKNKSTTLIFSPDKKISVGFGLKEGKAFYTISHSKKMILQPSQLGLVREDADFSQKMVLVSSSNVEVIKDNYVMLHGKKRNVSYIANKQVFHLKNADGKALDIIFQVSNDGVAFRYYFPESATEVKKIKQELTSFRFDASTKGFLHPLPNAKMGWNESQPSYEELYYQDVPVGTPAPYEAGWTYPALFHYDKFWVAITETAIENNYCGTRLSQQSPQGEYSILFPRYDEGRPNEPVNPASTRPWYTPWRILVIADNLATLTESTLGTDLATPAQYDVSSWLKPGKASWSWAILKDNSVVYDVQKQFIDYASDMQWRYCLIDVNWDTNIGYEKIKELADYAQTKKVGLILWYNSAGSWNTVPYHPKDLLLTPESRKKEFQRIQAMGIKGIKVDFFGGDGQSMMTYYQDILKDAAEYEIAVNFHGCTLPRGWARTYPNLVSMEAIRGFEFTTFEQVNADAAPNHCCMLPFTRNLFDPMDFTPVNFSGIPNIERKTRVGFEIALSVMFLSGIQHYADIPEGMAKQPDYVKKFMKNVPEKWDDMKFLDGFPGKYAVIARKSGNQWYISGINGENIERSLTLKLPFVSDKKTAEMITDGAEINTFEKKEMEVTKTISVTMKPYGGFVMSVK